MASTASASPGWVVWRPVTASARSREKPASRSVASSRVHRVTAAALPRMDMALRVPASSPATTSTGMSSSRRISRSTLSRDGACSTPSRISPVAVAAR